MFVPPKSFVVMQIHGCDSTVLASVDAEVEVKRIYGEQRADY
jgi:hypothetical protein